MVKCFSSRCALLFAVKHCCLIGCNLIETGQQLQKAGNSSEFACMPSGACAAEALEALFHTRLPPLPAALSSSFNSLQTRVGQNQDLCDTCKLAVFEAAAILGNVVRQP